MIKKNKSWVWPIIFLAPYFINYLVFSVYPILYSFYLSLTKWNAIGPKTFVGFDNYIKLLTDDPTFWKSVYNTFLISLATPFNILVILIVAVMINSALCKFAATYQTLLFLPYLTTSVALGVIFSQLFQWENGIVNMLLLNLGLVDEGLNWLGEPWLARFVTILVVAWKHLGYSCVIVMAGLQNISSDYYEAAKLDGAGPVRQFTNITIPLLKPILLFMTITSISGNLQLYDIPLMLFAGSPVVGGPKESVLTAIWYMVDTAFGRTMQYGYASAISYTIFVMILTLSLISYFVAKRGED